MGLSPSPFNIQKAEVGVNVSLTSCFIAIFSAHVSPKFYVCLFAFYEGIFQALSFKLQAVVFGQCVMFCAMPL